MGTGGLGGLKALGASSQAQGQARPLAGGSWLEGFADLAEQALGKVEDSLIGEGG